MSFSGNGQSIQSGGSNMLWSCCCHRTQERSNMTASEHGPAEWQKGRQVGGSKGFRREILQRRVCVCVLGRWLIE